MRNLACFHQVVSSTGVHKMSGHNKVHLARSNQQFWTHSASSKGSRKVEQFRSRCQEEMKEEVKMNKSKAEPVSW